MDTGSRESRIDSKEKAVFTPNCKARIFDYASFRFHVRIQTNPTCKRAPEKRAEKHVHNLDLRQYGVNMEWSAHAIRFSRIHLPVTAVVAAEVPKGIRTKTLRDITQWPEARMPVRSNSSKGSARKMSRAQATSCLHKGLCNLYPEEDSSGSSVSLTSFLLVGGLPSRST